MKSIDIIDAIGGIRVKNNDLWMGILQIAARYAPTETADLLAQIRNNDAVVTGMNRHLEEALRKEAIDVVYDT